MELKKILKNTIFRAKHSNGIFLTEKDSNALINNIYINNNNDTDIKNFKKKEILEEIKQYKKLFLEDRTLKLLFTELEFDNLLEKNVKKITTSAEIPDGNLGNYNSSTKAINVANEVGDAGFDEILSHELTHAISNRDGEDVGLITKDINLKLGCKKGMVLNEGLTEYINRKFMMKKNNHSYYNNYFNEVYIIQSLCMTYGEEFIFKAYKYGPQKLAKQLEKDNISYNELSELLDEALKANEEKSLELLKRTWDITRGLLIKKYSQATLEEKFEMAKRTRNIIAEQTPNSIIDPLSSHINIKLIDLEKCHYLNDIVDYITTDLYRMYTSNHEIIGNINPKTVQAVKASINTVILGTNHIPLDDIKEMRLEEVKNKKNLVVAYILKHKSKIVSTMYTNGEKSVGVYENSDTNNLKPETIETLKRLEENYKILEPIKINEFAARTGFILNTPDGTKFISYENDTKELDEFSVEDKFSLGDVIVEKTKGKRDNIVKKTVGNLLQTIKLNQKNIKMLPTAKPKNVPFTYIINDVPSNIKLQASDFLEEKVLKEREKFSIDILGDEFREKYKVDIANLKNPNQNSSNLQKNKEETER